MFKNKSANIRNIEIGQTSMPFFIFMDQSECNLV